MAFSTKVDILRRRWPSVDSLLESGYLLGIEYAIPSALTPLVQTSSVNSLVCTSSQGPKSRTLHPIGFLPSRTGRDPMQKPAPHDQHLTPLKIRAAE